MSTKNKNGFEYYAEQLGYAWAYYFRPVGAQVYLPFDGRKTQLLTLLDDPLGALHCYLTTRARYGDVEQARKALARAEENATRVPSFSSADNDPGGRRNNPGKVLRALSREPRDLVKEAKDAKRALETRLGWRKSIDADPFDEAAWRERYLPSTPT